MKHNISDFHEMNMLCAVLSVKLANKNPMNIFDSLGLQGI